jgi:hypothetical protein
MVLEALAADMARINAQVYECAALANSADTTDISPLDARQGQGARPELVLDERLASLDADGRVSACMAQTQALAQNVSRLHDRLLRMYAR